LSFDTRCPTCGQIAWAPEHEAGIARAQKNHCGQSVANAQAVAVIVGLQEVVDELKRKHDAALARAEAAEAKLTDAPWEEIAYIANAIDDHPVYEQACAVIHAWLAANAPQDTGE
jgi:hypothetical protein